MIRRQKVPQKLTTEIVTTEPSNERENKQEKDSFTFRGLTSSEFVKEMERRREEVMRRYKVTEEQFIERKGPPIQQEQQRKQGSIRKQLSPKPHLTESRLNRSTSGLFAPLPTNTNQRAYRYTTKQQLLSKTFLQS